MAPRKVSDTADRAVSEGRERMAENFLRYSFSRARVSADEFQEFKESYLPEGFVARIPESGEKVNTIFQDWIAIPLAHFEVGLRLPFWPKISWLLGYLGLVPAQLSTNAIATLVAFVCYTREERIEFPLDAFRKMFNFRANSDGTGFFTCPKTKAKIVGTANKVHYWSERFVFVKGPLGDIPYSPIQKSDDVYKPPYLSGAALELFDYFQGVKFDVIYLRRHVDSLRPVAPKEGMRVLLANTFTNDSASACFIYSRLYLNDSFFLLHGSEKFRSVLLIKPGPEG